MPPIEPITIGLVKGERQTPCLKSGMGLRALPFKGFLFSDRVHVLGTTSTDLGFVDQELRTLQW